LSGSKSESSLDSSLSEGSIISWHGFALRISVSLFSQTSLESPFFSLSLSDSLSSLSIICFFFLVDFSSFSFFLLLLTFLDCFFFSSSSLPSSLLSLSLSEGLESYSSLASLASSLSGSKSESSLDSSLSEGSIISWHGFALRLSVSLFSKTSLECSFSSLSVSASLSSLSIICFFFLIDFSSFLLFWHLLSELISSLSITSFLFLVHFSSFTSVSFFLLTILDCFFFSSSSLSSSLLSLSLSEGLESYSSLASLASRLSGSKSESSLDSSLSEARIIAGHASFVLRLSVSLLSQTSLGCSFSSLSMSDPLSSLSILIFFFFVDFSSFSLVLFSSQTSFDCSFPSLSFLVSTFGSTFSFGLSLLIKTANALLAFSFGPRSNFNDFLTGLWVGEVLTPTSASSLLSISLGEPSLWVFFRFLDAPGLVFFSFSGSSSTISKSSSQSSFAFSGTGSVSFLDVSDASFELK